MLYKTLKIASCTMLFFIATIVQAANVSSSSIDSPERGTIAEAKKHVLDNSKGVYDTTIISTNPEFYIMAFPGQITPEKTSNDVFRSRDRMKVYFSYPNNKHLKAECEIIMPLKDLPETKYCVVFGQLVTVEVIFVSKKWLYKVDTLL